MKQNLKLNLRERKKQERGITLVALVVTIVVLLILAGITIVTLTGENGIIKTAQNAKVQIDKAVLKEQIEMAVINSSLSATSDTGMDLAKLEVDLLKINGLSIESKGEDGSLPWRVTVNEFKFKINEDGTVEEPEERLITGRDIIGHEKEYYGKEVLNYKASENDTNTYRIFYVSSTANEFGDPQYTIYLKADDSNAYKNKTYDLTDYELYDTENTKVRAMNPDWANGATSSTDTTTRGDSESSWNINEQAAAYLCSPVNETNYETTELPWKEYYNQEAANYAIGGPSAEMYVKSYNQAYNGIITDNTKYPLGAKYRETGSPGYIYKINNAQSTISNSDYSTGRDSLDYTRYNSMYCGKTTNGIASKTGYWWLASPSAWRSDQLCYAGADFVYLGNGYYASYNGLCPLVSLKSGFQVQIEL